MKPKKDGRPKGDEPADEPSLEEFVKNMHGEADVPQDGMPPLAWLKNMFRTKSAAIRYLSSSEVPNGPFTVKQISKHMNIRYQMVRNIVNNPLKRGPNEPWRPTSLPPKQEV